MNNPVTYIGFFQAGQVNDTKYWNFFPVMQWGTTNFVLDFPNVDFFRGRLQLKQKSADFKTLRNIQLHEITDAMENTLVKVTFDTDLFVKEEGNYLTRIELPKNMKVRDAIEVEYLLLSDFADDDTCVLIKTDDLMLDGYYKANLLPDFSRRPESNLFNGDGNKIPYALLSDNETLVSSKAKSKEMSLFSDAIVFDSESEMALFDAKDENLAIINVPFYAENWSAGWNGLGYDDVAYQQFVRIPESPPKCRGKLSWNNKTKKYFLEPVGDPTINSRSTTAAAIRNETTNVVEQVYQYLLDSGRDVSKSDVINYCLCITQGFITTFAGAPGTGKTSLCRLLAKALGLQEREEIDDECHEIPRYTEVSVERGWTSLKDFIGYPDPFAVVANRGSKDNTTMATDDDHIIPSNIDVYDAFKRMDTECRDGSSDCNERAPELMLLDEANLSPIEYYWSQFLRNCQLDDPDELKKRKIQVSRNKAWLLSPNLRFLATVNFDHTTEELSPRFLDRTWVINLEPPKTIGKRKQPKLPAKIKMGMLNEAFGYPRENEVFPVEAKPVWDEICRAFCDENVDLPLSPRNINAVENYCIAAARFEEITAVQALDLAVLQKILPTISGYGTRYETLTDSLLKIADENNLSRTAKKLKSMKDAAEQNSNFYQFFIR